MLSQIGCVTLHTDMINKMCSGVPLDKEEKKLFANHLKVGSNLLANIPRLESVAQMIASQQKPVNRSFSSRNLNEDDLIALGGYILKITLEFDKMMVQGLSLNKALARLKRRFGRQNPEIINVLANLEVTRPDRIIKSISLRELRINMIIDEEIKTENGVLLVSKGQEVTYPVLERLRSISKWSKVDEPFQVIILG